jgi:hypothetical protein
MKVSVTPGLGSEIDFNSVGHPPSSKTDIVDLGESRQILRNALAGQVGVDGKPHVSGNPTSACEIDAMKIKRV